MSLDFPNIDTSQTYTLHFQNRKFYEIKYHKSLGRVEIFCGKLGPSNKKIMDRLYALYKEIQGEREVKNFMTECMKKKITKGYQFLDLPKTPPKVAKSSNKKIPATASPSILGKRSGQTIDENEPDVAKKLNIDSNTAQPPQNIINPEPIPIQIPQLSIDSPKSPMIEIESPPSHSISPKLCRKKASSPIQMVEEIPQNQNPKKSKKASEKKPQKPELPKKENPLPPSQTQKNPPTQIKEEHKNEKPNLFTSSQKNDQSSLFIPKIDKSDLFTFPQNKDKPDLFTFPQNNGKPNLFTSPPKIDKPDLFIPSPKIEASAVKPLPLLDKYLTVKADKSNPQIPPVKMESGSTNPSPVFSRGLLNKSSMPSVKNEDNSEGTKFFNNSSNATAEQRREEFSKKLKKVAPGDCPFGEPTLESSQDYLTVPSKWENEDVENWYISEKLNGIRCLWNGLEMWPKSGPQYNLPDFFVNRLPKSPLDGELVMKDGSLSRCMMVVKKKPNDPDYEKEWNNMSFVVYDAPEAQGKFFERLQALESYFEKTDGLYINLHEYQKCKGKRHAEEELKQEEKKGGEGILLTNPDGKYTRGKTKDVLERKSKFLGKAIVKEVITEKGKPQVITSLKVVKEGGIEFMINRGITNDLIRNPPQVGSEILYEYKGVLDSDKPKAPVYKSMI